MKEINVNFLNELGEKWLQSKIQRMRNLLKIAEPDEALYREIMLSLGYPKNKVQFLELALMTPFREIRKLRDKEIIEKALLYRAGFTELKDGLPNFFDFSLKMERSIWDFKRIRPTNYPDKRISGISHLLAEVVSEGLVNFFIQRILEQKREIKNPDEAKRIVEKIMSFKGIGIERKREMFFNIILPFCFAYYYEEQNLELFQILTKIFEVHPPLSENSVTSVFKAKVGASNYHKLVHSAKTYFGVHYYMRSN